MRETIANDALDSLSAGIDDSQTTLNLNAATKFPATGDFRIIVGSEIMLCTARSTNTLTVVRGAEGTTPASHTGGAPVSHIVTTGGITALMRDNDALWGSDRPPLARIINDAGDGLLTAADFTMLGQVATVTDQNGTILLRMPPQVGEQLTVLARTAPSTPYAYIAAFQAVQVAVDVRHFGLCFRQSGGADDGKIIVFSLRVASAEGFTRIQVRNYNSFTSFGTILNGPHLFLQHGEYLWLKIEDDGTNLHFYAGDGFNWILFQSVGRTAFSASGFNQVGWYASNFNGTIDSLLRLCHWSKEAA